MTLWGLKVDNAFKNIPIQFSSLQVLSLWFVNFGDDQIIQNIISSCPLIEQLTLYYCGTKLGQSRLKYLRIQGLHKLKKVWAKDIEEIDIDAPNLEAFIYEYNIFNVPFKINVDKCRNIKEIELSSLKTIVVTDQWLLELFCKLPLLERLELQGCRFSERIKVSCVSLKILKMDYCSKLKEVIIDAPNLCSLIYGTEVEMPMLTLLKSSSPLQFDVILRLTKTRTRYWDFQKLREFLQGFEHRDILTSLTLNISWIGEFNPDVLRDISVSPPSIKHLNVKITSICFGIPVPHLVTGLLCSCCPATIFMPMLCGIYYSVEEVFKEVLIDRKQDECCCSSSDIKCWWHSLKDVKVTRKLENSGSVAYPVMGPTITFELKY